MSNPKGLAWIFLFIALVVGVAFLSNSGRTPSMASELSSDIWPLPSPTAQPSDWHVTSGKNTEAVYAKRSGTPVRGVLGDWWADVVLGQPNFSQITPNEVVGNHLFNPGGVYVDRSTHPNRVYIFDAGNNRILGFSSLGICQDGANAGLACTSSSDCAGATCRIQPDRTAEIVLGQPSLISSACNGDSAFQSYPDFPPASARSLCAVLPEEISILESGLMVTMASDDAGNLYVPDGYNNRVLRYDDPFAFDDRADYVWGQPGLSDNVCNKGAAQPDATSLCLAPQRGFADGKSGVALDATGNLWVADTQNNRVLRFPYDPVLGAPAGEADLVLGQPGFFSAIEGDGLNQMESPGSIRVSSSSVVYVADHVKGSGLGGRVLVFEPPLFNGMSATRVLNDVIDMGEPTGLELDPDGGVWVNDSDNERLLRFENGAVHDIVTSIPRRMWGGFGVDQDGNIMISGWDPQHMRIYAPPAYDWRATFLEPDQYGSFNQISGRGLHEGNGLEVAAGQLIHGDGSRMLFWNFPWQLTTFQEADGVVGEVDFQNWQRWAPHFMRMRADAENKLWVVYGQGWMTTSDILAYELPLRSGAEPIIRITSPIPLKGGGVFEWTAAIAVGGMDVQSDCDCLWLSDPNNHRVFRIRDVSSTARTVDIVLGQHDIAGVHCNQGRDPDELYVHPQYPTQDSLCYPGALTFDGDGNLFVSDHNLELAGNWRLLMYAADSLPPAPESTAYGISAARVFGRNDSFTEPNCVPDDPLCGPWEPAFDSQGRMVVGFNGYLGPRFPQIYQDPLNNPLPVGALNDFYSQPFSARFDQFDHLYVHDLTRHRILLYRSQVVPTHNATGTILTDGDEPVSGVVVTTSAYPVSGTSNDLGIVQLSNLIPDTYTLTPYRHDCTFMPPTLNLIISAESSGEFSFKARCTQYLYLPTMQSH
jgi:sugar lactone lactonase YvrE